MALSSDGRIYEMATVALSSDSGVSEKLNSRLHQGRPDTGTALNKGGQVYEDVRVVKSWRWPCILVLPPTHAEYGLPNATIPHKFEIWIQPARGGISNLNLTRQPSTSIWNLNSTCTRGDFKSKSNPPRMQAIVRVQACLLDRQVRLSVSWY